MTQQSPNHNMDSMLRSQNVISYSCIRGNITKTIGGDVPIELKDNYGTLHKLDVSYVEMPPKISILTFQNLNPNSTFYEKDVLYTLHPDGVPDGINVNAHTFLPYSELLAATPYHHKVVETDSGVSKVTVVAKEQLTEAIKRLDQAIANRDKSLVIYWGNEVKSRALNVLEAVN